MVILFTLYLVREYGNHIFDIIHVGMYTFVKRREKIDPISKNKFYRSKS